MRKNLRVIITAVLVCALALFAAACSEDASSATVTPVPTETEAPMIVLTPAPTPPTATQTADENGDGAEASASATATSSSSSSSSSGSSSLLKEGAEGEDVTELQERLQALGYLDKVTGYFGSDTRNAVIAFQEKNDLDADGIVGSATLSLLMSEDAEEA